MASSSPRAAPSFAVRFCRAVALDVRRAWGRRLVIVVVVLLLGAAWFVALNMAVAWEIATRPVQNIGELTSQAQLLLAAFGLAPTLVVAFASVWSARASARAVAEMRRSREHTDRSELLAETRAAISAVRLGLNRAVIYAPSLAVARRSPLWWGRTSVMFRQMSQLQQAAVEVSTGMNQLALLDKELAEVAGIALDEVLGLVKYASAGADPATLEKSAAELHRITQQLELAANTRTTNPIEASTRPHPRRA